MKTDETYIKTQYQLAVSDYQLAHTEDARWEALRTMARLQELAAIRYGFEYADKLATMYNKEDM